LCGSGTAFGIPPETCGGGSTRKAFGHCAVDFSMPNTVNIVIETDLSDLQASGQKISSALDPVAGSVQANFEAARQKVIQLTQALADQQKTVVETSTQMAALSGQQKNGAISASELAAEFQKLNAQQLAAGQASAVLKNELAAAATQLRAVKMELQAGSAGFGAFTQAGRMAGMELQAMSNVLGVQMPFAMGRVLGTLPLVQAAMSAAFSAVIVGYFIEALAKVGPKLMEIKNDYEGMGEVVEKYFQQDLAYQMAHEKTIPLAKGAYQDTLKQIAALEQLMQVRKQIEELAGPGVGGEFGTSMQGSAPPPGLLQQEIDLTNQLQQAQVDLSKPSEELVRLSKLNEEEWKRIGDLTQKQTKDEAALADAALKRGDAEQRAAAENAAFEQQVYLMLAEQEKQQEAARQRQAKLVEETARKWDDLQRVAADADARFIQQSATAHAESLTGRERVEAETAEKILRIHQELQDAIDKIEHAGLLKGQQLQNAELQLKKDAANAEEALRQEADAKLLQLDSEAADKMIEQQQRVAAENQRNYQKMEDNLTRWIDQVFRGAKGISDIFSSLWNQILGTFEKFLSRMLAEWLLGMNQMGAAASGAGGGGGLLGGLLGTILGGKSGASASFLGGGGGGTSTGGGLRSSALFARRSHYEPLSRHPPRGRRTRGSYGGHERWAGHRRHRWRCLSLSPTRALRGSAKPPGRSARRCGR